MKSLKNYLQINEMTEEYFNKFLKDRWGGYNDLYEYFSDRIPYEYKDKNKLDKYLEEIMSNVPREILDAAKQAKLDPEEVCYQALRDQVGY